MPLNIKFRMLPVKWEERIYLIHENALPDFANAINLGLEPRSDLGSEPYYGAFYLRDGDELKAVGGKPSLTAEWRAFLLSKPVHAKILAIEEKDEDKIAIINRGRRDGLKVGMKLVGKESPSPWSPEGLVLSIEERTARLRVFDWKVGDVISTRYEALDIYR